MSGISDAPAKVKLRAVVYVDYEADPRDYGSDDPVQMAAVAHDGNLGVFFDGAEVEVVVMPRRTEA